jgi:TRAP-type C4-dicarboxylate transport system permease small subunit
MSWVHAACERLARFVRAAVVVLTVVMLASLTLQVVMRYVFNKAPSWTEELAIACFSWSILLAIALGVRDAIHARVDVLVDALPAPLRAGLDKLVLLVTAGVGLFTAWYGVRYAADSLGATSAAIGYPTIYLYSCAPVCGALIAIFAFERLLAQPLATAAR